MLYRSYGVLRYGQASWGPKLVLEVEQSLADYYRALIPRYYWVSRGRYGAHVSVVRKEPPGDMSRWGEREGEVIPFSYDPHVEHDGVYFWLNVFSRPLEELRLQLGMAVDSRTRPPYGFRRWFHITIGNVKEV